MALLAACPDCRKNYRVPHAEKEWRCKVCDVPLELSEPDEADALECPQCGAEIEEGDRFCEECGTPLQEGAPSRKTAERKVAGAKMRQAMGRVRMLRFFLYLAMFGAVFRLLVVAIVAWMGEIPLGIGVLGLAYSAVMVGLIQLAFHYLERRPFPVALALALLATLEATIGFLADGFNPFLVAWAVFFWITTIFAAQVTRLAREHPDLYLARKMSGQNPRRSGGARTRRIQENYQHKQRRKFLVTNTVFGLLTIFGFVGLATSGSPGGLFADSPPPSPTATLDEFKDAWNRVDLESLADLAAEEHQEKRLESLSKAMRIYDWGTELPTVRGYTCAPPTGDRAEADFHTVGGDLRAVFRWDGERWISASLNFKSVKSWRP